MLFHLWLKLASVPCLPSETATVVAMPSVAEPNTLASSIPEVVPNVTAAHQVEEEAPPTPCTDLPDITRFVKMLQVGVPQRAVEQKMRSEGYDPILLNSKNPTCGAVSSKQPHYDTSSKSEESSSD